MKEHPVVIGGLFRCCILSVVEQGEQEVEAGAVLTCRHCGEQLALVHSITPSGYAWEWRPEP